MSESRGGEGDVEERPKADYQFFVRCLVEQIYVVTAENRVQAEIEFNRHRSLGLISLPGVVQSIRCDKKEEFNLDPEEWEVDTRCENVGAPTFYTVVHKKTGLRKTRQSLREAHSKVVSDLSRRGLLDTGED